MKSPHPSPASPFQRFCRKWLATIVFYPPAIFIAFWFLNARLELDLFYSVLFTPFLTPFVAVGELLLVMLLVFYPRMIASDLVMRFRRHPWIRPLYLRCRERAIRKGHGLPYGRGALPE